MSETSKEVKIDDAVEGLIQLGHTGGQSEMPQPSIGGESSLPPKFQFIPPVGSAILMPTKMQEEPSTPIRKANDGDSVLGDTEFDAMEAPSKYANIEQQINASSTQFPSTKEVSVTFQTLTSALKDMDLKTALANLQLRGDSEGSATTMKARRILQFITDEACRRTDSIGRRLLIRMITSDYSFSQAYGSCEVNSTNVANAIVEAEREISRLLQLTAVEPQREYFNMEARKHAKGELEAMKVAFDAQFDKWTAEHSAELQYSDLQSLKKNEWDSLVSRQLLYYQELSDDQFITAHNTYRDNCIVRMHVQENLRGLKAVSERILVYKAFLNGLYNCMETITAIVKAAITASVPALIGTLNKVYKHKVSLRESDTAFNNNDLCGIVFVLQEEYKVASLSALSRELKVLFALESPDPLLLDNMLTASFNTFDFLGLWELFHPVTLRALLLTTGVKDKELARRLDDIQTAYLRSLGEKMSVQNISMDDAISLMDEPLQTRMRREITDYNQNSLAASRAPRGSSDSTPTRTARAASVTDAPVYLAAASTGGTTPTEVTSDLIEMVTDRVAQTFLARFPQLGQQRSGGGQQQSGAPRGSTWYVIRSGTLSNRSGKWTGTVESTHPAADRDCHTTSTTVPVIFMRYKSVVAGRDDIQERRYVAQAPDAGNKSVCPHCSLQGHKPYGCLQKGYKS